VLFGVKEVVEKTLSSEGVLATEIREMSSRQLKMNLMHEIGVIINDEDMNVVLYTPSALEVLGWELRDLEVANTSQAPPMLTVSNETLTIDRWPAAQVMKSGEPCKNVPLQIFSRRDNSYHWILVSAYPCHDCLTTGEKLVTVIIRRLESLGRV
jgi:hypothetical protein